MLIAYDSQPLFKNYASDACKIAASLKKREVADTPNSNGKRADLNPVKMTAQLADTLGALNRQP